MNDFNIKNANVILLLSNRKTVSISVLPDSEVKIHAPKRIAFHTLEKIVESKKLWILNKLESFKTYSKRVKTEDTIYFLGEELCVVKSAQKIQSKIENNILHIQSSKNSLVLFLKEKAVEIFAQRLKICFNIFNSKYDFEMPDLIIRSSKQKLGSMLHIPNTKKGKMTLNLNLIHLDVKFIDYVIFHELCHLKYKGHGKRFYQLKETFVPNWKELRKEISYFILK